MQEIIAVFMEDGLFIHELLHILIAFPFAYLLYKKTNSIRLVILLYCFTLLMDADHLVDYFAYYGFHLNIVNFFKMDFFRLTKISYVPLHGWEWLSIVGIFAYKRGWKSFWMVIFLGMMAHLILDTLNVGSFWFYSIIFRYLHGFYFP